MLSSKLSPFTSDEMEGSLISLVRIPSTWQALLNDRNVRVDGWVKYNIARLFESRVCSERAPSRSLAMVLTRVVSAHSSSRSGREN